MPKVKLTPQVNRSSQGNPGKTKLRVNNYQSQTELWVIPKDKCFKKLLITPRMFVFLCLQLINRIAGYIEFCSQNEVQENFLDKIVCSGTRLLVSVLWLVKEAKLKLRQALRDYEKESIGRKRNILEIFILRVKLLV